MTDDVPRGYLTLDEVHARAAARVSDQDALRADNAERVSAAFGLARLPPAPDDSAGIDWMRRQLAAWQVQSALSSGELAAFVLRDDQTGEILRLTVKDWFGSIDWWATIVGGRIRASLETAIYRYAGRQVLVEETALEKWLATLPRRSKADAQDCLTWLTREMEANPAVSPHPKAWYRAQARRLFGVVSEREFERVWGQAKLATRSNWGPGRRKKSPQ